MRSVSNSEQLSAKDQILRTALILFANKGVKSTPVRAIAEEAGVSQGLVIHHFGSKDKLRKAVDSYVLDLLEKCAQVDTDVDMRNQLSPDDLNETVAQAGSPWSMFGDSPLTAYLRRMVTDDAHADSKIVQRWHTIGVEALKDDRRAAAVPPGPDPAMRAAVILALDLGSMLLREQLTEALGVDPLSTEGAQRWLNEVHQLINGHYLTAPVSEQE